MPTTELWDRIKHFNIDDPQAAIKYSQKLALTNGWTRAYTDRVIEEYRKFIYLCCILPGGASPSAPIDEAWHLHLTYTRNYWKEFCGQTLEKEIHHFPSKGGPEEKAKHLRWYNETLEAYTNVFGEPPPADIWLPVSSSKPYSNINTPTVVKYREVYKKWAWLFIAPFIVSAIIFGRFNIYKLTGPQFLIFFSILLLSTFVFFIILYQSKKAEVIELVNNNYAYDANIFQLARFVYGREKSFRAAIVDLVGRKILDPSRKDLFTVKPNYRPTISDPNPIARQLQLNAKEGSNISFSELHNYYDDDATYHDELAAIFRAINVKDWWPVWIAGLIYLMGIARLIQGYGNEKPITFLVGMLAVSGVFIAALLSKLVSSRILQQYFTSRFRNNDQGRFASTSLAAAFVFLGLSAISLMYGYDALARTFSRYTNEGSGDSFGGSSCGGTGSCGSSCGSGCGGCGGGD